MLVAALGWGEARFDAAHFAHIGARYKTFYTYASPGAVVLTVPPASVASAQPVHVRRFALCASDEWTTTVLCDPASTLTLSIPLATTISGPHYVVVRLPAARLMAWTHYEVLPEPGATPARGSVTTPTLAERWRALVLRKLDAFFDEDTTGTWLANNPTTDYHWMREDAYYAVALLDTDSTQSHERANAILRTIAQAQDRVATSPTYGWFFVNGADMRTPHNASTFFIPPILAHLCLSPPPTVAPETLEEIRAAVWYVTDGVASRFVFPPIYENFYFMGTATLAMAGRIFGNEAWAAAARAKLEAAHASFLARGGSVEWASPVYVAVSDWALGLIAEHATDPVTQELAEHLRHRLWLDVAAFFHPRELQATGPFSRVYEDGLYGGAGLTAFALACLAEQEGLDAPERLAEMVAAHHGLDINPAYWIAKRARPLAQPLSACFTAPRPLPAETRQTNYYSEVTVWLTDALSLGSISATTAPLLGCEGVVAQIYESTSPTGLTPLYARVGSTQDDAFGYGTGDSYDLFSFQHHGRLLMLADKTFPSSAAPASQVFCALVAEQRFGDWSEWRVDGVAVAPPASFNEGAVVTARRAGAYLCAIPLYASVVGTSSRRAALVSGDGVCALALFGQDALAPAPIAGKRFEAAWALELSPASPWSSYDEFVAHCLSASALEVISDTASIALRWDGTPELEALYDRERRQWLAQRIDGADVAFPLLESEFALQSASAFFALRDFSVTGAAPFSWLAYPWEGTASLVGNPSPSPVSIITNWLGEGVEISGYGRRILHKPPASRVEASERYR